MTSIDPRLPPGPYCYQTTALPGEHDGKGHVYLVDAAGKKIASIWGNADVKMALVGLFIDASSHTDDPPPVDMILPCPNCGRLHIDGPDERSEGWQNPPHRSHLCHYCGHIWRPADIPTNGVATILTKGSNDSPPPSQQHYETVSANDDVLWNEAMEVAASVLDERAQDLNCQRDPGMANHCRSLAKAIRAKKRSTTVSGDSKS